MIEIFLLRHAPTAWNREGRIQGHTDTSLSSRGAEEAARWRLPASMRCWPCLSSPLRRAMETGRAMGLDPRPSPALIEMDWGAIEGRTLRDVRQEQGAAFAAAEALGLDFRPPGGETPREVGARVAAFLAGLREDAVVISHKGVVRALFALATGWTMRSASPVRIEAASGHRLAVHADGRLALLRANVPLAAARAEAGSGAIRPPATDFAP